MNDLTGGMTDALEYIENNLTEDISVEDIAARAFLSPFYFQKIFHVLCGYTVGEYIRMRRLSCAAQELMSGDVKVIDTAMRYGYSSPDSFSKAFAAFHGISPSAVKNGGESGTVIRSFAPLRIKISLEGGNMLEYSIKEKASFTIVGYARKFSTDTSYAEIPQFWQEHFRSGRGKHIMGKFGACLDSDGKNFEYIIADNYMQQNDIPEGCVTRTIRGGLWAVFPCRGELPDSLQSVNTKIWSEWLQSLKGYELDGDLDIEVYFPPAKDPKDNYSEIWIPVRKV